MIVKDIFKRLGFESEKPFAQAGTRNVISLTDNIIAHITNDVCSIFITKPFRKFYIFSIINKTIYLGGYGYKLRRIDDLDNYVEDGDEKRVYWAMRCIEKDGEILDKDLYAVLQKKEVVKKLDK